MADLSAGTVVLPVKPEMSGFGQQLASGVLNQSRGTGEALGSMILGGIKKMAVPIALAVGAFSIGELMKKSIEEFESLAGSVKSMGRIVGGTTEQVSGLRGAMQLSGVPVDQMNTLMTRFSVNLSKAGSATSATGKLLQSMGITATDAAGNIRPMADLLPELADQFQNMPNGADKTSAAIALFGRQGVAMLPFLSKGSEGIAELTAQAKGMGLVLDDVSMKIFSDAKKATREFSAAIEGAKVALGQSLLPIVESVNNVFRERLTPILQEVAFWLNTNRENFAKLGEAIGSSLELLLSGDAEGAFAIFGDLRGKLFDAIRTALPAMIDAFAEFLPKIIEFLIRDFIGGIVEQFSLIVNGILMVLGRLVPALVAALPGIINTVIQSIVAILPAMITQLLGMIPRFFDTALLIFKAIVDAVIETIPILVNTLTYMLPAVITALMDMLPSIIQSGLALFMGIVNGLITAIPIIIDALLPLLPLVLTTLLQMLPQLIESALELFLGIVMGLVRAIPQLIDQVEALLPKIIDTMLGMIPQLVDAAITLFLGIQMGLAEATPQIVAAVLPLIPRIAGALFNLIPTMIGVGFQILQGLLKGLWDNAPRLIMGWVNSVGTLLENSLKEFFGIKSPSTVFQSIGQNITQGLVVGLNDGKGSVIDAAQGLADAVDANFGMGKFNANISTTIPATVASRAMGLSDGNYQASVKPFGSMGMDGAAGSTINYYAAPNASISAEEKLVTAIQRARVLGWNH
jgi:phage-related protein